MITAKKSRWVSPAQDMRGFFIYCFTCKAKVEKRRLKANHWDHEVDWVRKTDSARHAFLPDNEIPKVAIEDGF